MDMSSYRPALRALALFGCFVSALVPSALLAEELSGIEQAYQKEFAFLESQKQELLKRLEAQRRESDGELAALKAQIDSGEQRLLSLENQTERLNERILDSEQSIELNQSNSEVLAATLDQAMITLADYGFDIQANADFNAGRDEAALSAIYTVAQTAVSDLSNLRTRDGVFYLRDGAKTEGTIITVGNIASYGVSERGAGVLAPVGGGELKLWGETSTDQAAKNLLSGERQASMPIFLYESLKKGVDEQREKTVLDTVESGGIIAWVIVALGLIAVLLILLRAAFLRAAGSSTTRILRAVGRLVMDGKITEALDYCKRKHGSTSRVLADTLRNLDRDRDHLEDIVSESILHESTTLNRFGTMIIVIAAVSPLLGLLGTVTGMIATFDVITEFGTGDPKLLSGGISTALVTTELGLVVAIPTLIMGNLLNGWSNRIKDGMEKAALHVTNLSQSVQQPAMKPVTNS